MKHLYIILLILPLIVFGQGWEQIIGSTDTELGKSVQQTYDGGYIITGYINNEYMLMKTDENGEVLWTSTFGDFSSSVYDFYVGNSVVQTLDGGYIIVGNYESWGSNLNYLFITKTNENGELLWTNTLGEPSRGNSIYQTYDGGYIITGSINTENTECSDIYLLKIDQIGQEQGSWTFGGMGCDSGYSVQQTSDGGYIITGRDQLSSSGPSESFLMKTNENGQLQWTHMVNLENVSNLYFSVQQTIDGGYVSIGGSKIIKTDESGNELWTQSFNLGVKSGQQTTDGGYIVTGNSSGDLFLLKTDGNGNEQWVQIFSGTGPGSHGGHSVRQTNDGGYIIVGRHNLDGVNPQSYDIYLIKTDSESNVETTSTIELPTPKSKRELVKTTNILGQENTPIKNQPLIEIYDDGSVEKKYIVE